MEIAGFVLISVAALFVFAFAIKSVITVWQIIYKLAPVVVPFVVLLTLYIILHMPT